MIKVATYNIKNKTASKILRLKPTQLERFRQNVELIVKADPDIIGLQEVTKEEYEWLEEMFGKKYKIYGDFRGSIGITNEACPIMVKEASGYVTNYGTFSISDDIYKIGKKYPGAFFPRVSTFVNFIDDFDEYFVMNMHVDNSKLIQGKTFKENGAIEKIMGMACSSNKVIIGDMNTEVNGPLKDFCDRNFFSDAALDLGKTYKPLNMTLDHILYDDDELNAYDAKALSNDGSDHSLIMAKIEPKGR